MRFARVYVTAECASPNPKCGLPVTKSTGCNHSAWSSGVLATLSVTCLRLVSVTCSRCRQDFCYLCGSVIGDVSAHYAK